ncbi:hypothetical protein [Dyadobacter crusticola]|uniref:hypothetical protein n=1 Tax=Dyadobacter crusticola TaxID=292407 RepID=UPI0012FBF96F|nr:hypothetical protein [Dyadobacter crusticola]
MNIKLYLDKEPLLTCDEKGDRISDLEFGQLLFRRMRTAASCEFFHRIISANPEYVMPTPESHLSLSAVEKAILIKWIRERAAYQPHWAFASLKIPCMYTISTPLYCI